MKKIYVGLAVAALSLSALSFQAQAAPPAKAKAHAYGKAGAPPAHAKAHAYAHGKSKSKMVKCPMCGMALSSKRTKGAMAMKVNGKTYYCQTCGMHKMHKGTAHKMRKHAQAATKHAVAPLCKMCNVRGKMVKANGKTKFVCPQCKMTL